MRTGGGCNHLKTEMTSKPNSNGGEKKKKKKEYYK
jgi:hypothetical protein